MRYQFSLPPPTPPTPRRPHLFMVGVGMFVAAIATAAVVVACSERGSKSGEIRAAEPVTPAAVTPAAPTPGAKGEPVTSGPVSYDRADPPFRDSDYGAA